MDDSMFFLLSEENILIFFLFELSYYKAYQVYQNVLIILLKIYFNDFKQYLYRTIFF